MTNQTEQDRVVTLMNAAIDEIKYTLESSKDKEVKEFYLKNAIRFIEKAISVHNGRLDEAVKALEWYSNIENYEMGDYTCDLDGEPVEWDSHVQQDFGELARTTLKRIKGENGHE